MRGLPKGLTALDKACGVSVPEREMEKYKGMQNVEVLDHRAKSTTWKRDYLLSSAAQLSALLKVCFPPDLFQA